MDLLFFPLLLALVLINITLIIKRDRNRAPNLPPSPWKMPLLGHMHHLLGDSPHRALRKLSLKYGPIMYLKLGHIDHIIISSPEAAREILKTHDLNFASRPQLIAPTIVFYNNTDIAFAPYGSYWRQIRKICVLELLSARRVKSFGPVRESETSAFLTTVSMSAGNSPVNLTEKLFALTNTMTALTAFGFQCKHGPKFITELKKGLEVMSGFQITDLFPSLSILGRLFGTITKLKRIQSHIDEILSEIITEHQTNKPIQENNKKEEDLVDVLLRIKGQDGLNSPLSITNIKAVTLDIFSAGTETSAATLIWAMAELMHNPKVMDKAQDEVREVAKGRGRIEESDLEKLPYMKMVIKETLRLHPPLSLLLPRICQETCKIRGFEIPAGCRVIINAWAIGRDPGHWEDAESFRPERFEGSSVDFKGENFQLLPFGGGRRICPGILFAMATVEFTLANLLFLFDWELPDGKKPSDFDMSESAGITVNLKSDLCLIATPRFPLPAVLP